MRTTKIMFVMGLIILAFSVSGVKQVADDYQLSMFFYVYAVTGAALSIAAIIEMIYQTVKRKRNPAAAIIKEQVILPADDTVE